MKTTNFYIMVGMTMCSLKKRYKNYDVTTKNYISDILDVTFCDVFNSHTNSREVHLQPTNNFPFHLSLCVQPEFVTFV